MDNTEIQKERTEASDQQLQKSYAPLAESATVKSTPIPRNNSFSHFLLAWQPMGIRVQVKIPYVSDDGSPIFYIRVGPHIPDFVALNQDDPWIYWMANQFPVKLGLEQVDYPADPPVVVSQFDAPPPLAQFARMFRRWRGSMQYRLRVVANNTQQGYLITYPIKNEFVPPAVHNPWKQHVPIIPKDASFKDGMLNSYIMSDLSFQRHIELDYPFEFPNKFYDQYMWLSDRSYSPNDKSRVQPHGDNFIAVGARGSLSPSTATTSQIFFELEYRAGDDFQFADPFVPGAKFRYPIRNWRNIADNPTKTFTFPDSRITSDGISKRSIPTSKLSPMQTTFLSRK